MQKLIGIGAGAGAVAGLAAFGYARVQVAPLIRQAIDYEEERSHALSEMAGEHDHGHGHELFTRAVQENVGAGVGVIGFGVVVGILFAVAYAVLSTSLAGRGRSVDSTCLSTCLGMAGFLTVSLAPFIFYPGNPPGVGQEVTSGHRTVAYLVLLIASVAAASVLAAVALRYAPRVGTWTSVIAACWSYVGVIALAATILPKVHEVPDALVDGTGSLLFPGFPADLLYNFRLHSVLTAAVMWMVLATAFAVAVSRASSARTSPAVKEVVHGGR
ncbi:CbtA family protein [Mycolicibacterium hippocampi]|uniref:Cobalt transporter n=1 Tax=Mycolicibacterium hippocampi TaxID=659824 RepID=A0A7I9ZJ54_9MYCO|nr:CbtA family protein [Mycolicibacterium hippocampi]GFH01041.1 hypothetical protein MHIP_15240 [Mycolicibacterium hippocampi]